MDAHHEQTKHASEEHDGFAPVSPDFERERGERAQLVQDFLAAMNDAGNPGTQRRFGSAVRELTGQPADEYWSIHIDPDGGEREVLVFTDGRHGFADEIAYSDRPRTPGDEINPQELGAALEKMRREFLSQ